MEYGGTAHNRTVLHVSGSGFCFAKLLFGLSKRRKQSERYAQYALKLVENILLIK
jgi:hypothetical protein